MSAHKGHHPGLIKEPGARLGKHVPLKFVSKGGHGKKSAYAELNLTSMVELAQANGIKVVLASVMPTCDYIRMQSDRRPNSKIIELNKWIKDYTASHNAIYLDYFTPMLDDQGALKKEITYDGLHPNDEGYELIMPMAQKAIERALAAR